MTERLNASTLLDRNLDEGRAEKPAYLTADGEVTYGRLAGLAAGMASYLTELGLEREQRVLMILDDSPAFPATFLGAMRIGAVPVPVNPMDRADNYPYYLQDSYAKVLVVEAALLPSLEAAISGVHVIVVDGDPGPHASFEQVVSERIGDLPPAADTHRDDMAFWLYSSGSTGRPKGVVHAHRDIPVTVDTYGARVLGIAESDLCYSTTKLFHAYGLGNSLSFPLSVGATAALVKGRSTPHRILEAVGRHRPSLFFSVPALYAALVKAPGAADVDFSSIRACVSAAEALPAAVLERWLTLTGVPILDGIGSTEMLHIYCSNTLDDLVPGSSGRPVPGYELRLVDELGHEVTAADVPGELVVQGESCAAFYWHQREKTRRSMRGDWFHTGDRYIATADGHYVYQGRADDMIKVGGLWVSPVDVEACLVRHPAVSEAAVIGTRIEDVSRIKAFVIADQGGAGADRDRLADELRQWCKGHLRRYEYPHVVEFVEDLPRTATGKVQRFKLREAEETAATLAG